MHQLVIQEPRRTSNIPGLEKTKMVMVLCYLLSVSSASVWFDSSAPPFAFSIFLRSLSYFLRSPTLSPSCFLLNVTYTPSSLLSFFFSAFIAKTACVFSFILKTFGNGPIIKAIKQSAAFSSCGSCLLKRLLWRWWWIMSKETAPFHNSNEYFRFGPWLFWQFCNQAPRMNCNWIPWF